MFLIINNSSIDLDTGVVNGEVVIDEDDAIDGAVILTLLNLSEKTWDLPIILDYRMFFSFFAKFFVNLEKNFFFD